MGQRVCDMEHGTAGGRLDDEVCWVYSQREAE